MASSGTDVFTLTRDQMVAVVLKKLRVLLPTATPDGQTLADFGTEFNIMLKFWATKGLKLWTNYQLQVPMVANKDEYTIGPSGADVISNRPLRLLNEGNFIRQTINGSPYDTPLRLISRMEYEEMGSKLSNGVPNSIYYQPTIDTAVAGGVTSPSTGYGRLKVYVTTNSQSLPRTMFLNSQRQIFDVDTGTGPSTQEFDLPTEWFEAIRCGMAYRMADSFEVAEDRQMRLKQEYNEALEAACDWSVEQAPMQIVPDFSTMSTSPYRR